MITNAKYDTSIFLNDWKEQMWEFIQTRYGNKKLSKEKVMAKLDKIISASIKNPKVSIINNYTNQSVRTDILSLIDLIEDNHLIIAGGGTLFHQHKTKRNILIEFIIHIMEQRIYWKGERKKYEKGTYEYQYADLMQGLMKLIINSLYGCLGYPGFALYNVFLAEAITNQGRHIITTSITAFEGFLGDALMFDTPGELYTYIANIQNEYKTKYRGKLDIKPYRVDDIQSACMRRLIEKCSFTVTQRLTDHIQAIIEHMDEELLHVLYYKNNLIRFSQNPSIKARFKMFLENNGALMVPELKEIKDPELKKLVEGIWELYDIYVLYDYPVFDRIRKAMYVDKTKCLYTDTDSVFISLDHLVSYCEHDVLGGKSPVDEDTLSFTSANLMMIFLNIVVDKALKTLCYSCNITKEWAKRLTMKNEFFFKKILFTDRKKRYISLALLQEGKLLGGGKGVPEIKGFDFKKATTKEYLRNYYEDISVNDILYPPVIHPNEIFDKMVALKKSIETGVRNGDTKFFKQSSVKPPEQYKNPFQTQGVTAILLWNAICPDYAMDFPNDVNIVPIKEIRWELSTKKQHPLDTPTIAAFAKKYPAVYDRLYRDIYNNSNELIRHMGMKYIATPKNPDIPIPDYIYDIIDYDKIVTDAIALFLPIMNSIGIKSLTIDSNTQAISNIVEL